MEVLCDRDVVGVRNSVSGVSKLCLPWLIGIGIQASTPASSVCNSMGSLPGIDQYYECTHLRWSICVLQHNDRRTIDTGGGTA